VLKRFHAWVFGYGSPVTLGVLRLLIGMLAVLVLLFLIPDYRIWLSETGLYPVAISNQYVGEVPRLSLLIGVTDPLVTGVVFGLTLLAAVMTALGLSSRIATVALFIGLNSLHFRVPEIINSGDTLLRLLAFYLMLAPCGAAVSLDRLLALWRGKATLRPREVSLWPQRLIQFQLVVVYLTTVLQKLQGDLWLNGTAAWYPLQMVEFRRFPLPEFLESGVYIPVATYGTLVIEVALGTLVFFKPLRKYVLLAGIFLHVYIEYRFNIPFFAAIIVTAYLSHYRGEEVSAWFKRLGAKLGRKRMVAKVPPGFLADTGPGAAIRTLDPLGLVRYEAGDGSGVKRPDGQPAAKDLLRRMPVAWPFWLWPKAWSALLRRAARESASSKQVTRKHNAKHA
jgi:hypothetical protein